MNGLLIDAAKRILKRRYGVVCTEPFAGVDRFRRTTGNLVAQVSLESVKGGPVYKVSLYGFYYNSDETYDEELQIKATETMNPIDMAELIDEWLSRVETNLSIQDEQHRQYSKKKRILSLGEAKEVLKSAGLMVVEAISMYSRLYDFYRFINDKAQKTGYDLKIECEENSITVKFKDNATLVTNTALVTLEKFDEDEDPMLYIKAGDDEGAFYNEHSDWANAFRFIIKKIVPINESISDMHQKVEPAILESNVPRTAEEWKRISEIWLNKRDEQVKLLQDHPLWIGTPAELKTKKLIAKYDGYYKKAVEEWKKCV